LSAKLKKLLKSMSQLNATDLHLSVGSVPRYRISGKIQSSDLGELSSRSIQELFSTFLSKSQTTALRKDKDLAMAFDLEGGDRFRLNLFHQKGKLGACFRRIPSEPPGLTVLGLPSEISEVIEYRHGLVLVSGATGSGKTTTIASMLDAINKKKRGHIVTLEDPIEYLHPHNKCIVTQREIGTDCLDFETGYRELFRIDPDYILVGEIRDRISAETALKLAESGHLVFGTLHSGGAQQSISRLISLFEPERQAHVRELLAVNLKLVVSQMLLSGNQGLVLVPEIVKINTAVQNLIRKGQMNQVYSAMQSSGKNPLMKTFEDSVSSLVRSGHLSDRFVGAVASGGSNG